MGKRSIILTCLGDFWPGNEASGPNQSLIALERGLRSEFEIRVIATNPEDKEKSGWSTYKEIPIRQLPPRFWGSRGLHAVLTEEPYDILLLNGFHDKKFTIPALAWRKLGMIPRRPTVLSPRGEFAPGALSLKSWKKKIYRRFVRRAALTNEVWLHATADHERRDIESAGLRCRGILQAPNVRLLPDLAELKPSASLGKLQIAFLGRVSPVKNLEFALDVLATVSAPVNFNIYGPMVDKNYWTWLQARITQLPDHIAVTMYGALQHDRVPNMMAAHDLFFLPTLGENFGHAISEALSAGLPALIADTTPWRGLQAAGAGWDLSLARPDLFAQAIQEMAQASTLQRQAMRKAARRFAEDTFAASDAIAANRRMFHRVLDIDAPVSGDHD